MVADETQTGSAHTAPDEVLSAWQKWMVADETQTGSAHVVPDEVPSSQQKMVADETQTGSAWMAPDEVPSSQQEMATWIILGCKMAAAHGVRDNTTRGRRGRR